MSLQGTQCVPIFHNLQSIASSHQIQKQTRTVFLPIVSKTGPQNGRIGDVSIYFKPSSGHILLYKVLKFLLMVFDIVPNNTFTKIIVFYQQSKTKKVMPIPSPLLLLYVGTAPFTEGRGVRECGGFPNLRRFLQRMFFGSNPTPAYTRRQQLGSANSRAIIAYSCWLD